MQQVRWLVLQDLRSLPISISPWVFCNFANSKGANLRFGITMNSSNEQPQARRVLMRQDSSVTTVHNVPTSSTKPRPSAPRAVAAYCSLSAAITVFWLSGINYASLLFNAAFTRAFYAVAGVEFVPDRFDHGVVGPLIGTAGSIVGWMVFKRLIELLVLGYQQWRSAGSRKSREKLTSDSLDAGFAMIKPDWLSNVVQLVATVIPMIAAVVGLTAYKIYAAGLWPSVAGALFT